MILINKVKKYTLKREPIKSFIIQVPLEKKIKCLCFTLLFNNKFKEEFHTDIEVEGEDNNYFYLTNHHYEPYNGFNDPNGGFIDFYVSTKNDFISNYFSFFFDKTLKIKETYQKSLINTLINKISNWNRFELGADNILRFFKYCLKFNLEPRNIKSIKILEEKKSKRKPLDPEYCLLSEEIDRLILNEQRPKFNDLIVYIYANYNIEYLMELIFSNTPNNYNRAILDLLMSNTLNLNDLSFKNLQDLQRFQINLLYVSKSKEEINYILKNINGLTKSLEFLQNNLHKICLILEKNAGFFRTSKDHYLLALANLTKDDNDINEIYHLLSNILNLTKDKNYKIINLEEIFDNMVDFFSNKELNEFCTLHNIVGLLESQKINSKSIDNFYYKLQQKGMYLNKHDHYTIDKYLNCVETLCNMILKEKWNRQILIQDTIKLVLKCAKNDSIKIIAREDNELKNKLEDELNKEQKNKKILIENNEKLTIKLKESEELVNNLKEEISNLNEKIKKLEESIENNNNSDISKNINNLDYKDFYKTILEKDNEIKQLKNELSRYPFRLLEKEKIMTIILSTINETINYSVICKNTEKFKNIKEKFYNDYPEFIKTKNIFTLYGKEINVNKSLEQNNIKNNDIIILKNI